MKGLGFLQLLIVVGLGIFLIHGVVTGVQGSVSNIRDGFNADFTEALNGQKNIESIDHPIQLMSNTGMAVATELDKGLGVVGEVVTMLFFVVIFIVGFFVFFAIKDEVNRQKMFNNRYR